MLNSFFTHKVQPKLTKFIVLVSALRPKEGSSTLCAKCLCGPNVTLPSCCGLQGLLTQQALQEPLRPGAALPFAPRLTENTKPVTAFGLLSSHLSHR